MIPTEKKKKKCPVQGPQVKPQRAERHRVNMGRLCPAFSNPPKNPAGVAPGAKRPEADTVVRIHRRLFYFPIMPALEEPP